MGRARKRDLLPVVGVGAASVAAGGAGAAVATGAWVTPAAGASTVTV